MIVYHSSDIIKRAEQLADLENSQFISFSEKIALLNEAYTSIYQKSINHDVNSFVKYINTRNNVIQLPPDFYQLKAITMSSGNNGRFVTPITRRPMSANRLWPPSCAAPTACTAIIPPTWTAPTWARAPLRPRVPPRATIRWRRARPSSLLPARTILRWLPSVKPTASARPSAWCQDRFLNTTKIQDNRVGGEH